MKFRLQTLVAALGMMLGTCSVITIAQAASHREAPITALDEKADITDFYAFVSYDDPNKITLILDVDPLLEPANGPNYFRASASGVGVPGVLDDAQEGNDDINFASDDVSGYNVNAIAIEVPVGLLTADGLTHSADEPLATIGTWGTTARPKLKLLSAIPGKPALTSGTYVQIQRMGNPLFNELLIGTGDKDRWSQSMPAADAQFAAYALDPVLARVLNAVYDATVAPDVLPVPTPPRTDLLPLVQYLPPIAAPGTPAGPVADMLRLNTGVPPTVAAQRSRLGFLTLLDGDTSNDDPAGFPNGRRLSDDVTDIAARVVAGVLAGPEFNRFPHNRIGDGVNTNDTVYRESFPYLGLAQSGRESRHIDPSELGCTGTCPID